MEVMEQYDPFELYHHGIKGMKWGVRRFQNKDGSLTNAGGKRYNGSDYKPRKSIGEKISAYRTASKRKKNLAKAREAAAAKRKAEAEAKAAAEQRKKDVEAGKISARKMTTEELNDRINKMNLEKRYTELMEQTNPSTKATKVGKDFVQKMWKDAVQPALADAGRQLLKDAIIKSVNKKSKEEINSEALAKMAKDWNNKANIARDKKNAWKNEYDLKAMQKEAKEKEDKVASGKNQQKSSYEYKQATGDYARKGKQIINDWKDTKTGSDNYNSSADTGRNYLETKKDTILALPDKKQDDNKK